MSKLTPLVTIFLGTRPEAIKLAPVILAFKQAEDFRVRGKPVLVLRRTTERPEAVDAGTAKLIGTNSDDIVTEVSRLLKNRSAYEEMSKAHNPFGEGRSSQITLKSVSEFFGI